MQIQFDKLKNKTELLSGTMPPQVAFEAPPAARPVQPKVWADKGMRPEIEPEKKEQEEQYEDVLKDKDKWAQASALSPQMAKVIRCNVTGLYQQKAHRQLKKITEHADILTWNENGEAVINRNAIPDNNFKSLYKSLVSNQQNLNQVGIDEFLRPLRSLGVKKDDISGEPLKMKYSNVAPYSTHQRHSTPTKYEDEKEDDDEKDVRPPSHKHRVNKDKKTSSSSLPHKKWAMFTSHPGASLAFYMFINLFIKFSLTISFHLFYSHFNWFNKIDILICNVDQYGDMDWKFEDKFAYCKYTVWSIRNDLRF